MKEFEALGEDLDLACLFYQNPSSAEELAAECRIQGIDCETWTIAQEETLRAAELSHTASGYIVQLEGNRLEKLYLHTDGPSCMISSRLADTLFRSEQVIGKHILYQEISYTIKHIVPGDTPVLFLNQNTYEQPKDFPSSLSIVMVREIQSINYHKAELLLEASDAGIISDMAEFPVWFLPGKWSDLEGWSALWKSLKTQLSAISRFRDYPVLCSYYQSLAGCFRFLLLCFFSLFFCSRTAFYSRKQ